MSDTVKLIIEIPELAYKACQKLKTNNDDGIVGLCAVNSIANGTPLDSLKADLHATAEMHSDGDYYLRDEWIDEYFDNVGKGVSE